MILIATNSADSPVLRAETLLRDRGAKIVRFDPDDFPSSVRLALAYRSAGGERDLVLHVGAERVDLDEIDAVWYRRPRPPQAAYSISDSLARDFVELESQELLFALGK